MSKEAIPDLRRRRVTIYTLTGLLPIPVNSVLLPTLAHAAEHLTEDNAQAKALAYKQDATKSARPSQDQQCANCTHIKAAEGDWRPCEIFPGKDVAASGWCNAWAKKTS